jgi:hypothetical protein
LDISVQSERDFVLADARYQAAMVEFLQNGKAGPYDKYIIKKGGADIDGWLGLYQHRSQRKALFYLLNISRRDLTRKRAGELGYISVFTNIPDDRPASVIHDSQPSDENYWRWAYEETGSRLLPLCFLSFHPGNGVTFWYPNIVPPNWMYSRFRFYLKG